MDAYTIEQEPVSSFNLMERAADGLYRWLTGKLGQEARIALFAGSGNNGGEALALARMLVLSNYKNLQIFVLEMGSRSSDCKQNLERLRHLNIPVTQLSDSDELPDLAAYDYMIDGIFGSGLNRPVTAYWAQLIEAMNGSNARIIAIDIPSGLFAENNADNTGSKIKATITLSFQVPKLAFFMVENQAYVGSWHLLDIGLHPLALQDAETTYFLLEQKDMQAWLPARSAFAHKGDFGHAFLVAGSYQKTGAAVLAARACLRSGVGLLTVHVPQSGYTVMQTAVPEAMLCIDESEMEYCQAENLNKFDFAGVGPGIGLKQSMQEALKSILQNANNPLVLDADALNILALNPEWFAFLPKNSILTPHPGEFDRLTQKHSKGYERLQTQIDFARKHAVIVVLKGAHTSIAHPDGTVYFNRTGNPGMATAGSGDVLTGIILSLLAQRLTPLQAALLGVYLHGLAGDKAAHVVGEESLIASDIIEHLGGAFKQIKAID